VFNEENISGLEQETVARRLLQSTYVVNDLEMIEWIEPSDGPSLIKLCERAVSGDGVLSLLVGIQLFYGTGDMQIPGPSHGTMS